MICMSPAEAHHNGDEKKRNKRDDSRAVLIVQVAVVVVDDAGRIVDVWGAFRHVVYDLGGGVDASRGETLKVRLEPLPDLRRTPT